MASTARDAHLKEALERLHAASVEFTRLRDISEIAETALAWALDMTRSSTAFLNIPGETDAADQTYTLTADGRRSLPRDEVVRLLQLDTGETSLVHLMTSGGHRVGIAGVTKEGPYTTSERIVFAVLANQLGAVFQLALLESTHATVRLRTELESRTEQLGRTVERLQTVDAARQLLLKNVVTAQEKAARRFASELHDDALQTLTAAELHLQRLKGMPGQHGAVVAETESLLMQTEESLRRLLFEVRPPSLENPGGLESTIRERVMMLKALTDAEVELEMTLPDDLAYEIKSMVFRQVAEAVTNIEKHARATRVELTLRLVDGTVHGVVVDNGQGFVVAERNNLPGHLGLLSLKERAILAGGWYKIESEPGTGTRIEFGLPIQ